jgi:hypothetical protein
VCVWGWGAYSCLSFQFPAADASFACLTLFTVLLRLEHFLTIIIPFFSIHLSLFSSSSCVSSVASLVLGVREHCPLLGVRGRDLRNGRSIHGAGGEKKKLLNKAQEKTRFIFWLITCTQTTSHPNHNLQLLITNNQSQTHQTIAF